MNNVENSRLRQLSFLLIIVALGALIFKTIYPFFNAILGAIMFYILFRSFMFYLTHKKRKRRAISAVLVMVLSFIIILVPFGLVIQLLYDKVIMVVNRPGGWQEPLKNFAVEIRSATGFDVLSDANIAKLQESVAGMLPNVLMGTIDMLTIIGLMYFVLYFMLTNGPEMEAWLYEYVPLKDQNVHKLGKEVYDMVLSNAIGIPLLSLIQGAFATLAYWLFGVPEFILWGVVTSFAAMLPVIGATAVWFPLSIYLYLNNEHWQGIALWAYGALVIVNVDNLFRIILQKKLADVHPLITMFGVIVGLSLFGFMGLIYGPLLVSMFILLLRIYNNEFLEKKRNITMK